jgi:hypothetical protein
VKTPTLSADLSDKGNSYHALEKCEGVKTNNNVTIIRNISEITPTTNYLIVFINYIDLIYNSQLPKTTNVIFIVADYLLNCSEKEQYLLKKYINENSERTYIWEYGPLNINYYKKNEIYCKLKFIPLIYNIFLEEIYKQYTEVIPYHKKTIDVLFIINGMQDRRKNIINKLKQKCNLVVLSGNNNIDEYCSIVENSKIIINIYSKEINKQFDYYRLALLYSNKALVINETMTHHDFSLEPNLIELNDVMINVEYDNMIDTVVEYLKKSDEEISEITEKIYQTFKKHDMKNYIMDFFESQN